MQEPRWWKECVVYQIYPKSFFDSNSDGIGDIPGITEKLEYLKWLGVDVLWLCPVYPSGGYDNGYDISDYESIAGQYGTMEDFEKLLRTCHDCGIKVLLDLVVNHTSDRHPWFMSSQSGTTSPERDLYIWREGRENAEAPSNWGALFGGPAWTQEGPGGQYYLHLFSPRQPDLNWGNEQLRQRIYAMMSRWLDRGVDGFRMDVISLIAKPGEMADGPAGLSGYYDPRAQIAANPELHGYLREMRSSVLDGRDVVTVGEASAIGLEQARVITDPDNGELDMLFQFEHMDLDGGETFKWTDRAIQLPDLKRVMDRWQQGLDTVGWGALFWNNHDQPRMLSRMGDEDRFREASAKMLATCLHMMKGTPFIYQGEEIGMTNMPFSHVNQLRDNESIQAFWHYTRSGMIPEQDMMQYIRLKCRDNARTPMQWSAQPQAGFTDAVPWMDVNPNYPDVNVQEQRGRPDSILAWYRSLIDLRHRHAVIVYGDYTPYDSDNPHVYAYLRSLDNQTLFVCCNFSASPRTCTLPRGFDGSNVTVLLDNTADSEYLSHSLLAPYESIILLKEGPHHGATHS